jgi:hypothetical protein
VKKTIIAITATAFLTSSLLASTAASAWVPLLLLPIVAGIKAKEDPNWSAKQAKAMHVRHHHKAKM